MTSEQKKPTTMNVILWIAQALLSSTFIWAATMKLFQPAKELAQMWPWTADNVELVKFTGIIDLLAGIGLIIPALLRIQSKFTIYSAYGTIVLMLAASIFHINRGESSQIGMNISFALIALFIAWGRKTKAPIESK